MSQETFLCMSFSCHAPGLEIVEKSSKMNLKPTQVKWTAELKTNFLIQIYSFTQFHRYTLFKKNPVY